MEVEGIAILNRFVSIGVIEVVISIQRHKIGKELALQYSGVRRPYDGYILQV